MSDTAAALDDVAAVAQRLAVLLAAGIPPERAWSFVAGGAQPDPAMRWSSGTRMPVARDELSPSADPDAFVAAAATAAARADDVAAAIRTEATRASPFGPSRQRAVAWGLFAATWSTAVRSGAPLAATLHNFADGLRHAAALHRELKVAFSGPKSTARMVGLLPLVALGFGLLMGFDTIHVLVAMPIGWGCLAAGFGLMLASGRWSGRLLAAAEPRELVPGLEPELVAVAMGSGSSVARARELVASALAEFAPFVREQGDADTRAVDDVIALASSAGVPAVGLLRAEAERRRADADADGRAAAATVAVRLMVPLAVCVLPAFMVLGVVPVLVALFTSSGITFG